MTHKKPFSLYFHVPFCTRKCDYCHFYVIPEKDLFKKQLMEGFKLEWEKRLPHLQHDYAIETIYFGGGTPALLGPAMIGEILNWIRKSVSFTSDTPEITLEANPENVSLSAMKEFAAIGINRISLGIQTLNESLLKDLNRLHQPQTALNAVLLTAEAGIKNISVDLMYDLPRQDLIIWKDTLDKVAALPITHLSLYNLTIEPHTVFFKKRESILKLIPNEETSLNMYEMAIETLQANGLMQYEISAFAKKGYLSNHNCGYWTGRPFLGFGPSAFSYWEGSRFRNVANLSRYWQAQKQDNSSIDFAEKLSPEARQRELLAIRLRLIQGVDLSLFQELHGELDKETKQTIKRLEAADLLYFNQAHLCLTRRGILLYDTIATEII